MPPKTEKKTKVKKEGPKKNKSAYMFFCTDARKEINKEQEDKEDKMDNKEIVREQGKRWKILQTDEKKLEHYQKLAAEDKKRYEKEKESFGPVEAKPKKTKEEKEKKPRKKAEKKKKDEVEEEEDKSESDTTSDAEEEVEEPKAEEPKKTRVNGYINYSKEMREKVKKSNPKLTPKEVTTELSKQWKALSDSEKEKFKNK